MKLNNSSYQPGATIYHSILPEILQMHNKLILAISKFLILILNVNSAYMFSFSICYVMLC